jgi:RNA polymerase sigma factor (sigma-70 family)
METAQLNDWLARWRAGDRSAADELVRAVHQRLEWLARKMLRDYPNARRGGDTHDVLQGALVRLMRALQNVDPPPANTRDFRGLAALQIRRELRDMARTANAKRRGEVPLMDDAPPTAPPDQSSGMDLWAAFHEAAERLPAEEREVVGLIFYHGLKHAEVAQLFDVSEKTVSRRWHSALVRLRAIVGGLPEL